MCLIRTYLQWNTLVFLMTLGKLHLFSWCKELWFLSSDITTVISPNATKKYVVLTWAISYLLFCIYCALLFYCQCMNTRKKLQAQKSLQMEISLMTLKDNYKNPKESSLQYWRQWIQHLQRHAYSSCLQLGAAELGGKSFLYPNNNCKFSKYFLCCMRTETRPVQLFQQKKKGKSMVYHMRCF